MIANVRGASSDDVFVFNLDQEPAMLRKRRRVGVGAVEPDFSDEPTDEADL